MCVYDRTDSKCAVCMLCAGCVKKYRLMIFISRPKHMRNPSTSEHERNEFIFANEATTNEYKNNNNNHIAHLSTMQRRRNIYVATIKRWCIQTPPCYWIYKQNVCNVVLHIMDFSVLWLILVLFFASILVHIIIIVSQLHLFTPINASWSILCSFFRTPFLSSILPHSLTFCAPLEIFLVRFICNLIPCIIYII